METIIESSGPAFDRTDSGVICSSGPFRQTIAQQDPISSVGQYEC